tara:strand:- start:3569 stop:3874 length:306 start_codon:yes stop_codon:yes gene_type:complete
MATRSKSKPERRSGDKSGKRLVTDSLEAGLSKHLNAQLTRRSGVISWIEKLPPETARELEKVKLGLGSESRQAVARAIILWLKEKGLEAPSAQTVSLWLKK